MKNNDTSHTQSCIALRSIHLLQRKEGVSRAAVREATPEGSRGEVLPGVRAPPREQPLGVAHPGRHEVPLLAPLPLPEEGLP